MKTIYQIELQALKTHDEIQSQEKTKYGYDYIYTAGHGYLVVPVKDKKYRIAKKICEFGFQGKHAIYLEHDCEVGEFIKKLK